ncbi:MAG: DUF6019 family protein [Lachnospiraceae bacterium]|nr:DUF6019 family protein [Lachnospiraceae bacterium]
MMNAGVATIGVLILWLVWIAFTLLILFFIIKYAVKSGIKEAYRDIKVDFKDKTVFGSSKED